MRRIGVTDIDGAMGWSDAGTLGVNMVGTYLNDFKVQVAPGGSFTEYGGTDSQSFFGPYPTWRFNSTFTYRNWGVDFGIRWRFIGAVQDSSVATSLTRTPGAPGQPPLNYFDLMVGYTLLYGNAAELDGVQPVCSGPADGWRLCRHHRPESLQPAGPALPLVAGSEVLSLGLKCEEGLLRSDPSLSSEIKKYRRHAWIRQIRRRWGWSALASPLSF